MKNIIRVPINVIVFLSGVSIAAALAPAAAQAATHSDSGLVGYNALNLTPAQEHGAYQAIGEAPEVTPPPHYLIHVGGKVPDSMPIKPLPAAAMQQAPSLKNDDYVKSDEGDVLVVKPQDRTIVEVIDRYHGAVVAQAGTKPAH